MKTSLRKKTAVPAPRLEQKQVRAQLARAAGVSANARKDPVSFVTESFQQNFDRIGAQRTESMLSGGADVRMEAEDENESAAAPGSAGFSQGGRQRNAQEFLPGTRTPLQKFGETAFQRGKLSASVLRGTGKMMLVSCLKRTVGQSDLESSREQNMLRSGAQQRNVPGHAPDSVLFTRGVAQGAVGLVVDTLRDARRVVQSMEVLATGTGEVRGGVEGSTLQSMYPFLNDSRERELLAEYRQQLSGAVSAEESAVLQNALVHTRALIEKKAQMKEEFINKLRLVSDRAVETLAELEAPGAIDEIVAAILAPEEEEELPPPTPPEDDGDDNGAGDTADEFPAEDFFGTDADAFGDEEGEF